jgi:hypothetical protein
MIQPRYDKKRGIYRDCKFCGGTGCIACPGEADKAYKAAFPNGPKPIATFKLDNPEDIERAKKTIGGKALEKAFGPGGSGVKEILKNIAKNP